MGRRGVTGLIGRRGAASLALAALAAPTLAASARAELPFVSLGSGETNGTYYPVARGICRIVNGEERASGVLCSPEATPGSVYNVNGLLSGELEFGIIQSDVAFDAYNGNGPWRGKPYAGLRSVFRLYPELVTIVARDGAHVHSLADLTGKTINVGGQGTGTRETWSVIEAALGWTGEASARKVALRPDDSKRGLCTGQIDANLLIVGHPSALVRAELSGCASNLVAVDGPVVDTLLGGRPYYSRGRVPADLYGLPADVPTFGGRAVLMTSSQVDAGIVAAVAKAVMGDIAALRTQHPALARLTAEDMVSGRLPAPLHPGAAQVYQELGLLKRAASPRSVTAG